MYPIVYYYKSLSELNLKFIYELNRCQNSFNNIFVIVNLYIAFDKALRFSLMISFFHISSLRV